MKNIITILVALLISISSFAQQGINYKAILKDTNGNVLTGTFMNVQFSIHQTTQTGTIVYQEDHNYNTDANGLLIHNIGSEPTPSIGVFADIDWGADRHFLQVTITYSGGTIDFDATEFMAVPYALNAANVSGLEAIDEGNGLGWRFKGTDPENYGPIGLNAVDMSYSNNNGWIYGATGDYSTAMGYFTESSNNYSTAMGNQTIASGSSSTAMGEFAYATGPYATAMGYFTEASGNRSTAIGTSTTASGNNSMAMGTSTTASGTFSTAMGRNTTASGDYSTAMGYLTTASGRSSTALGENTDAPSFSELAIGTFNTLYTPNNTQSSNNDDRLFVVGNGTPSARSNALTVLKNGTITAPSLTNTLINSAGDKALVTKEYLDINGASGLEAINEGNGIGWRLIGTDPNNYGPIGENAVNLSYNTSSTSDGATGYNSTAMGSFTEASGNYSTAMGSSTTASGERSTAMGFFTTASGERSTAIGSDSSALGINSTAMGTENIAVGNYSTAMGYQTEASGDVSTTMGAFTLASNFSALAIGKNNIDIPTALFMIGNGSVGNRNNALTVHDNGDALFDGEIQHTSTGSANMIPVAYGTIDSAGNILSGTGNFTVTTSALPTFQIDVIGETLSHTNSSTLVTPLSGAFRTASITHLSGDVRVYIFNSSGTQVVNTFQFVIYKL